MDQTRVYFAVNDNSNDAGNKNIKTDIKNNNKEMIYAILLSICCFISFQPFNWSNLIIYISLDNLKRKLYNDAFYASGYTTYPNNNNTVEIFCSKKEEIIKLLYHELCHCCNLDKYRPTGDKNADDCLSEITTKWNIDEDRPTLPNEIYAETFSILLNASFSLALINRFSHTNLTLDQIILAEIYYSVMLCNYILGLFNYSRDEMDYFFDRNSKNIKDKKFITSCDIYIWEYVFERTSLLLTDFASPCLNFSNLVKKYEIIGNFKKNNIFKFILMDLDYKSVFKSIPESMFINDENTTDNQLYQIISDEQHFLKLHCC